MGSPPKAKRKPLTNSAPLVGSFGKGNIVRDTRLILDSNEYIFGIPGDKASCAHLMERLGELCVYVPAMVMKEVRDNLQREYGLGKEFFRLIVQEENITVMWADPPVDLVAKYTALGLAEEDAVIAACAEWVGAEYLISENRHFLERSERSGKSR
jgi:predicted nucleic acid-binding protein